MFMQIYPQILKKNPKIYRNDTGSFVDINAALTDVYFSSVAWGDYDNDGDLDILVTGGYGDADFTFGFTKIYRNESGSFASTSDTLIDVYRSAARWGDLDNDGDLDILLTGRTTGGVAVSKIYRNEGVRFVDTLEPLENILDSAVALGDYDNDGDLDLLLAGNAIAGTIAKLYRNNVEKANIAPTTPTGLSAMVTGTSVTFNWNKSTDNQTPQNALTYNLRLGKISGGVEIVSPMAHAFGGNRQIPALGNTNHNTGWTIKNLAPGTYYWNVQAIDNAFAGSAFADEQSFTVFSDAFTDINASLIEAIQSSAAWWGDYDNDGDLDVLLTGHIGLNPTSKVYRNEAGNFVDIAAALTGTNRGAAAWGDYDNDGDLDILFTGALDTFLKDYAAKVWRNDNGNFVDIFATLPGVWFSSAAWGDYDNDGDLDILLTGSLPNVKGIAKIFRNNIGIKNTVPSSPTNLTAVATDSGTLAFRWNKSTDQETPTSGLTYNLRLGTTSRGVDKISPMADATTGYRHVVQLGNTNHNMRWTIQNLSSGRYYWSVQTIDNAFAGSTFASEQTFVIGDTVWPGDTNNNRLVNQADVLPIGLYWNKTGSKRDNASVMWQGQVALPWSPEAATFADANGDGIVNQADVLPIGLNWGQTRTASTFVLGKSGDASAATAATPTLGVKIIGDTNPGKTFWLDVHADSVMNLLGLAFELLYAPTTYLHVDTVIAGTWLGNDLVFLSYIDTTAGKISLAVSRKAPTFLFSNLKRKVGGGKDSSGVIARIKMHMSNAAVRGQATALTLQNVAANDPAGNPIQFSVINGSIITSVASRQQNEPLPQAFALHPNFPNPFNPSTMIKYDIPEVAEIRLDIFDMLGRYVRTLVNERQQAGLFAVVWDGRNENGEIVASGVFIYQLRVADFVKGGAGKFVQNRKLMLVR